MKLVTQWRLQILDLLLELREKLGTSIIMITHDLGVISRLCDRVVVMYGGKIVEKGEIGEIFYNKVKEGAQMDPEFSPLVEKIDAAKESIKNCNDEIDHVKMN